MISRDATGRSLLAAVLLVVGGLLSPSAAPAQESAAQAPDAPKEAVCDANLRADIDGCGSQRAKVDGLQEVVKRLRAERASLEALQFREDAQELREKLKIAREADPMKIEPFCKMGDAQARVCAMQHEDRIASLTRRLAAAEGRASRLATSQDELGSANGELAVTMTTLRQCVDAHRARVEASERACKKEQEAGRLARERDEILARARLQTVVVKVPLLASSDAASKRVGLLEPGTEVQIVEGLDADPNTREVTWGKMLKVRVGDDEGWLAPNVTMKWRSGKKTSEVEVAVLDRMEPGSQADAARRIRDDTELYLMFAKGAQAAKARGVFDADRAAELEGQRDDARDTLCKERALYAWNFGRAALTQLDRDYVRTRNSKAAGEAALQQVGAACSP